LESWFTWSMECVSSVIVLAVSRQILFEAATPVESYVGNIKNPIILLSSLYQTDHLEVHLVL